MDCTLSVWSSLTKDDIKEWLLHFIFHHFPARSVAPDSQGRPQTEDFIPDKKLERRVKRLTSALSATSRSKTLQRVLLWSANRVISSFLYLRELAVMVECFYWMWMHEGRSQVRVPVRSDHTGLCSLTGHKNHVQTPRVFANRLNRRGDDFQYQPLVGEPQSESSIKVTMTSAKRHQPVLRHLQTWLEKPLGLE
ncbi:unnamed protein product [Leuciscus chuanchicus]